MNNNIPLDNLIAKLNLMTTDFIFSRHQCRHRAMAIAEILDEICQHIELSFFPEQQNIYFKMLKVWQALAYDVANAEKNKHKQTQKTEPIGSARMH